MGSEKIKSTMCTHSDRRNHEEYSYLVNAVDKVSGEKLAVEVATTDYGIAVVDAYLYLRTRSQIVTITEVTCCSFEKTETIGVLTNYLLQNHLCEENKYLVACFCSSCDESETNEDLDSAIERLYKSEESSNTAAFTCEKLINDYNDPGQIKSKNGHIWGSYYFTESTGMMYEELRAFRKMEESTDPDFLWYWTFAFTLWGEYDCYFPALLYCKICNGSLNKYVYSEQIFYQKIYKPKL